MVAAALGLRPDYGDDPELQRAEIFLARFFLSVSLVETSPVRSLGARVMVYTPIPEQGWRAMWSHYWEAQRRDHWHDSGELRAFMTSRDPALYMDHHDKILDVFRYSWPDSRDRRVAHCRIIGRSWRDIRSGDGRKIPVLRDVYLSGLTRASGVLGSSEGLGLLYEKTV